MPGRVDDDGDRKQAEQQEPGERTRRGQPLADAERRNGRHDRDREDHHPGEGLAAALGNGRDRVHPDDRADQEEEDVEAAKMPLLPILYAVSGSCHCSCRHLWWPVPGRAWPGRELAGNWRCITGKWPAV
jgi:hypothetical protein